MSRRKIVYDRMVLNQGIFDQICLKWVAPTISLSSVLINPESNLDDNIFSNEDGPYCPLLAQEGMVHHVVQTEYSGPLEAPSTSSIKEFERIKLDYLKM